MTRKALLAFEDLLRRYPISPYSRDAQLKLNLLAHTWRARKWLLADFIWSRTTTLPP